MTKNGKKKRRMLRRMTPVQVTITVTDADVNTELERIYKIRSMWTHPDDIVLMPSRETVREYLIELKRKQQ